ncbi:GFA family protein [uncultured Tateyamaria sp.]|uniref:GFA family protein n=1 Tax=uncultured Tateyamaria sp. TaxID=455651 RepID=UPI0026292967|nr:GFA family protein [uncultured Tateyamaria sp.]
MSDQTTQNDPLAGGCYCGAVRFEVVEPAIGQGQCHCRACQHIAGGAPQYFLLVPKDGLHWSGKGCATFKKPDLEDAVTRYFCPDCGTHIATRRPDQSAWVLKVGTLDDPSDFAPRFAICYAQAQPFHMVPDGIPVFDDIPNRA